MGRGRETSLGSCEAAGVAEASRSLLHGEEQEGTWAGGGELASCCFGVCGYGWRAQSLAEPWVVSLPGAEGGYSPVEGVQRRSK